MIELIQERGRDSLNQFYFLHFQTFLCGDTLLKTVILWVICAHTLYTVNVVKRDTNCIDFKFQLEKNFAI